MNATKTKTEDAAATAEPGDALASELTALRGEVERLTERLRATEAAAVARAKALAGDLTEEWRRVEDEIVEETRRSPWRSLGIAALAGLVVGLVLRR